MTKRFTETISTGIVTDNLTGKKYKCEYRIDDELLNLLNTLAEENEHLKKERNYFERKKCEYFTRWNEYKLDNISLKNENEQLREALKNSYVTELCENCKYVIYESWEVPFCGWEHDRDCKKGHNECEVTECDDFELNLKVFE